MWCALNRRWRTEHTAMLARKDTEEAAAIEELREKAKKELADWYKHNEEQLQATKATNRYCLVNVRLGA